MSDQIIWMLAGVGCLILAAVALWVFGTFIDWLHSVVMDWRSRSFSEGEASVRLRLYEAADWFHEDQNAAELIRDLADGRNSVEFIRSEYTRRKTTTSPNESQT